MIYIDIEEQINATLLEISFHSTILYLSVNMNSHDIYSYKSANQHHTIDIVSIQWCVSSQKVGMIICLYSDFLDSNSTV
jgi:hypothetical protein